jgi:hypothetical protein
MVLVHAIDNKYGMRHAEIEQRERAGVDLMCKVYLILICSKLICTKEFAPTILSYSGTVIYFK